MTIILLNKKFWTILLFCFISFALSAQKKLPKNFCIDSTEAKLYNRLNKIRTDYGKPKLQLSASLSYVAGLHVADLQENHPDTSICNLSSWSDKGDWTPCCYTKYLHNPDCMWNKPKELTPYRYRGYEMVTVIRENFNTDTIINLWSDSKDVLDMILTRDNYAKKKWICTGIGISKNYISIWFGQKKDNIKDPKVCNDKGNEDRTDSPIITINKPNTYYLIYGSFNNMHDAKEASKKIKNHNFKNIGIFEKNNKFRIFLDKYSNMKEALFAKQQLTYPYNKAWILKD